MSAATVMIDASQPEISHPLALDLQQFGDIVADHITSTGRYIVIAGPNGKHRIWLNSDCFKAGYAYIVPPGQSFAVRMAATRSFELDQRGIPHSDSPDRLGLTARRHRKMALMLRLIDADQAHVTRREMAFTLVYPRLEPLDGAAWKGSTERRRTQRLIDEALRMMHGGYRALLQG